jgi:hypothetical protein
MPSGGSDTLPEAPPPTIFIDRNSGGRSFQSLLSAAGVRVVLHDQQFPTKTADEDWLAVVGERGWLIVTGDNATTRSPLFVHRLAQSRAHVFVLLALNGLSAQAKAQCIIEALPRMRKLAAATEPPALWRFGKGHSVTRFDHTNVLARMKKNRRLSPGADSAGGTSSRPRANSGEKTP